MINTRDKKISVKSIGLVLMCFYIFFSYTAKDILISSKLNTYALYIFLVWGAFYTIIRSKSRGFSLTIYTTWYIWFFIASFFTMLYSPEFSLLSGESYLMIVSLGVTYVIQLAVSNKNDFKIFCWCYATSASVFVTILYFTGNLTATASNRLGGDIVGNANTFAGMLMVAVMYEFWLIVYEKEKKITKIILIAMILFNIYALVLSGGRKFFLIPFIFMYILLILKTNKRGKSQIIRYTVLTVAIVGITYYLIINIPQFYDIIGYRMQYLINSITGKGEVGGSLTVREVMRELAMTRWLESPLWGYGFDSFKYYARTTVGHFYYSHCNYTELLYNGGVLYFVIYYWIYYKLIKMFFNNKNEPLKYRAFAIATAICILIFDYGAVSYSLAIIQIMIAMAIKVLTFSEDKNVTQRRNV